MRRSLYAMGLVLLFMCPHLSFAQTAEELNDRITGSTDTLYLLAVMWKHEFQDQSEGDKRYKSLMPFRKYLEEYADKQAKSYKKPSGVEGGDSLCAAASALFEFEKIYVKKGFVPFESLSSGSSEAEVSACKDRLTQEGIPERELLTRLNRERRAFAAKNGIDIAPPPMAPKPAYQRPAQLYKKKTDSDQETQPAPAAREPEPAPKPQPRTPVVQKPVPAERPTSSGNPNAKKAPPTDEDGKTPKDKDKEEGEEDDKD